MLTERQLKQIKQWQINNKNMTKSYHKKWYDNHRKKLLEDKTYLKQWKDRQRIWNKKFKDKNKSKEWYKEKQKIYRKRYNARYPEKVKERLKLLMENKEYKKNARENERQFSKRRRLRLRFKIFKRDNWTCAYCGRTSSEDKIKLEIDHKYPKSKGGVNDIKNYQTLCKDCNLGKGDCILNEFK